MRIFCASVPAPSRTFHLSMKPVIPGGTATVRPGITSSTPRQPRSELKVEQYESELLPPGGVAKELPRVIAALLEPTHHVAPVPRAIARRARTTTGHRSRCFIPPRPYPFGLEGVKGDGQSLAELEQLVPDCFPCKALVCPAH